MRLFSILLRLGHLWMLPPIHLQSLILDANHHTSSARRNPDERRRNARILLVDLESFLRRGQPRIHVQQERPHVLPHILRQSLRSSSVPSYLAKMTKLTLWKILFFASTSLSNNLPFSSNHAAHSVATIGVPLALVDLGLVTLYVFYPPLSSVPTSTPTTENSRKGPQTLPLLNLPPYLLVQSR